MLWDLCLGSAKNPSAQDSNPAVQQQYVSDCADNEFDNYSRQISLPTRRVNTKDYEALARAIALPGDRLQTVKDIERARRKLVDSREKVVKTAMNMSDQSAIQLVHTVDYVMEMASDALVQENVSAYSRQKERIVTAIQTAKNSAQQSIHTYNLSNKARLILGRGRQQA